MFNPEKAEQLVADQSPPKREIHVFHDRAKKLLRIEPRGVVGDAVVRELMAELGFPVMRGGAAEIVLTAAEVCQRHGWRTREAWTDEHKDVHVRMEKADE